MIYLWLACNSLSFVRDTIKMLTLSKSKRLRPPQMINLWLACTYLCFVTNVGILTHQCLPKVTREYLFETNNPSETSSIYEVNVLTTYLIHIGILQPSLKWTWLLLAGATPAQHTHEYSNASAAYFTILLHTEPYCSIPYNTLPNHTVAYYKYYNTPYHNVAHHAIQ